MQSNNQNKSQIALERHLVNVPNMWCQTPVIEEINAFKDDENNA